LEVVFGLLALAMLTLAFTSRTVRSERPMGGGSRFLQEIHLDGFGFPRVEIVADDRGGKRRTKGVQRFGGLPHRQTHERS